MPRTPPALGLLFLLAAPSALAAPTVEEQALQATLDARTAEAIRLLERDGDAQLRWVAGRVALNGGDAASARRIFAGPEVGGVWDRVDVALRWGDPRAAAELALVEMDRALAGVHRDALGRLLVGWAGERVARDEPNAARFLLAVLGLDPSADVRRAAEDQLFRLSPELSVGEGESAARRRLLEEPGSMVARYRVAVSLAGRRPLTAASWLAQLVREAPQADALAAARELVTLSAPDPLVIDALGLLGARFPDDGAVARLRLDHATALATRDVVAGTAALAALTRVPAVATDALEAQASATTDPVERRALWLTLAEREGVSARGDRAREEAFTSLVEAAQSLPTPEARRSFAVEALRQADGAGTPELLYLAIPDGAERLGALWSLAERFPEGAWCTELADTLVQAGATAEVAQRYTNACPSAALAVEGADAARILGFVAASQTAVALLPRPGGVDVLSANVRTLDVSEHHVDPEALFRATAGNPLDQPLDAFLLEPDARWRVNTPEGVVRPQPLQPRASGLVTLTVRADDQRATALVVTDPLEVQLLRRGGDVAIAVLRDGGATGVVVVPGAELLVQDAEGTMHTAKTDANGVAVLHDLPSALRVMARKGKALGFVVAGDADGEADTVVTAWELVLWDRAVPVSGAYTDVEVYATLPAGSEAPRATLESRDRQGGLIEAVVVEPAMYSHGAAHVRLFAQGGGSLSLLADDDEVAVRHIPQPPDGRRDIRIGWAPPSPLPGQPLVATLSPLVPVGPGGLAGVVTVTTPWSTVERSVVLTDAGLALPVDLAVAAPDDPIEVTFRYAGGDSVGSGVHVGQEAAPGPVTLPPVVGPADVIRVTAPAGSWVHATTDAGAALWRRAGEGLTLPTPGLWRVEACRELCGPASSVLVAGGAVTTDGTWSGGPTLAALTAEDLRTARVIRAGDSLAALGGAAGTRSAWVVVAGVDTAVPVLGAEAPEIAVTGTLQRGGASTLDIGAGLPEGSRVWAFLRDASDAPPMPVPAALAVLWEGPPGTSAPRWMAFPTWGEGIAAALLEEEERVAESRDVKRVDFNFGADAEVAEGASFGSSGYGYGGGGMGSDSMSGYGRAGTIRFGPGPRGMAGDSVAIGVHADVAPGVSVWRVPEWVGAADLEVIARTTDGRWASRVVRLAVGGEKPAPLPEVPPYTAPPTWDGTLPALVPIARSLPADARIQALAALFQAGVAEAGTALQASWAAETGPAGPGDTIARHLRGLPPGDVSTAARLLDGLADPRRAERAEAALTIAGSDRDRALAIAGRLVAGADAPAGSGLATGAWVRTRAGLAYWVAGQSAEALKVLTGDDPGIAAARAVVTGRAEPRFVVPWWTIVQSEGANPADRALALQALTLLPTRAAVTAAPAVAPDTQNLQVTVEPALAAWQGETFWRGDIAGVTPPRLDASTNGVPVGRVVPVRVVVPSALLPTRVLCPDQPGWAPEQTWIDVAPTQGESTLVECRVRFTAEAATARLRVAWVGPDGAPIGVGTAQVAVGPARDSDPADPMSPREQLGFGLRLGEAGDAGGLALLETLLSTADLPPGDLRTVSTALLLGRRQAGAGLVDAFSAYREHVPDGDLDLATAAALAHAYDQAGDATRSVAAARVVMDARFKEELSAVSALQAGGLDLTALKLLRELVGRYPEVPTVVSARYLAPSMLLQRAEGSGDRLGYTRSSLRHTAAAELAAFLLIHPEAPEGPAAAALLTDALHALGEPARETALAGLLARRFREGEGAWRLSLADARAHLAGGHATVASRILAELHPPAEGLAEVELERGRVAEALGNLEEARAAYARSGAAEARARWDWLERDTLTVPSLVVLTPDAPARIRAHLRPGVEVATTAIRINLEAVLLRDGGQLDVDNINVEGLKPAASRTFRVDATGDIPLPNLAPGAYLMTVASAGSTGRLLVVRTDLDLIVQGASQGGTLIHLQDPRGAAVPAAQLWLFQGGNAAGTARTDGRGAAWVGFGSGGIGVLARIGDRYAWSEPTGQSSPARGAPASPAPGYNGVLEKNARSYEQLFQQDEQQRVRADML